MLPEPPRSNPGRAAPLPERKSEPIIKEFGKAIGLDEFNADVTAAHLVSEWQAGRLPHLDLEGRFKNETQERFFKLGYWFIDGVTSLPEHVLPLNSQQGFSFIIELGFILDKLLVGDGSRRSLSAAQSFLRDFMYDRDLEKFRAGISKL